MSTNITLWGANELSRAVFGKRSPLPDTFYLALCVGGNPNPYLSGAELTEPASPTGYSRLEIPNDATSWDTDGYLTAYNRDTLTFVEAISAWGHVRFWALCNDAVEGGVYFYGTFAAPLEVIAGDIVTINAAALRFTLPVGTEQDPF